MDYETFNKGCLEEAKRLYKTANADQRDVLEKLFPELMGSEDEKIRKTLIDFFSNGAKYGGHTNGIYDKYILAWLEKQGTSYTKRDVDDAYLKGVRDTKNEIEKQYEANYQTRKDIATFIFNYRGDIKDRAKWMDYLGIKVSFVGEQGEQKNADKVEPKFKVGDWIIRSAESFKHNAYLVTGNMKHYPVRDFIVTPSEMIAILEEKKAQERKEKE